MYLIRWTKYRSYFYQRKYIGWVLIFAAKAMKINIFLLEC